ncbi:5-hydroxytryptamine receptor 1A-alpha-like [Oppia nitens]|uniref:5-hydroxytryptamine receptor 1A-alpha-like n=1 Tax=Oppia nitens TaxID=1686743 RepID=UPI0023DB9285|nr:5-hydroxytryptamine receptor 1A-alpha-like [Oppia nitens]
MRCRNQSPIFRLSLNLAATDAVNSLIVGTGLFVNSYLPRVFNVSISNNCTILVLEIFRLSSLVASALHLLAMAFIYYRGVTKPLHYRFTIFCSTHLKRSLYLVSLMCWTIPVLIFSLYFFSIPCQAFQSANCDYIFMLSFRLRTTVTVIFLAPLLVMSVLYWRIFSIIHCRRRRAAGSTTTTTTTSVTTNSIGAVINRNVLLDIGCSADVDDQIVSRKSLHIVKSRQTLAIRRSPNRSLSGHRRRYSSKTVVTTLSILGTYVICWMPGVAYLALTCLDGCPFPLLSLADDTRILIGFTVNALIIFKAIIDPFIYSFRMNEITALYRRNL